MSKDKGSGEYGEKLEEVLTRLENIERLVLESRLEAMEGSEGIEGDPADALLMRGDMAALSDGDRAMAAVTRAEVVRAAVSIEKQLENFIDGLGLANFRGSEFTPYWSRVRNGVRNSIPPRNLWPNIVPTLVVLQRFRDDIGTAVNLTSTYRSPDYNDAIGGAPGSLHLQFRAIDFVCNRGTANQWADTLKSYRGDTFLNPHTGDNFVFRGGIGEYNSFVHIDTRGYDATW